MFLEPIVDELVRHDAPWDELLSRHGFSAEDVSAPYRRVSLPLYVDLMEDAAAYTGNSFFGLDLGTRFQLSHLGPFYALLGKADTLGTALSLFARFQGAWQTRTSLSVARGEAYTHYTYTIEDPGIWPRRQDSEFTLATLATLIRQLGAPHWNPMLVEFEHSIAARGPMLRQFFKARVVGEAGFNRLTISNAHLDRRFRAGDGVADAEARSIMERHLRDLLPEEAEVDASLGDAVARCIAKRLGRTSVELDIVARELSLSERGLRRKLADERTSFREILQAQRRAKAEKLLEGGEAQNLGIGGPSRLFRRRRGFARVQGLDRTLAARPRDPFGARPRRRDVAPLNRPVRLAAIAK